MPRGKIDNFAFRGVPQEIVEFKNQVRDTINFGKMRFQAIDAAPDWPGEKGEMVLVFQNTTGWLYVNTSAEVQAWSILQQWEL